MNTEPTVVLIVEDNEGMQDVYQRVLAHYPWVQVLPATTQRQARDLFRGHRETITHIIMDGMVPGGDHAAEGRPNTALLVQELNAAGFAGDWIAASADSGYNQSLFQQMAERDSNGAIHQCAKGSSLLRLLDALGLQAAA
jgi:CheY-like chemotaxis protein